MEKTKIKAEGRIQSWGAPSFECSEVHFDAIVEECGCGGDFMVYAMLGVGEILEGKTIDDQMCIQCNGECGGNLDVNDYDIELIIPDDLKAKYVDEKVWCMKQDVESMTAGINDIDFDRRFGGKSKTDIAKQILKKQGVI
tara:strand:+ start:672 stop:1091 length:420 start_codon:yes stop_codon:yes gene_type:complete